MRTYFIYLFILLFTIPLKAQDTIPDIQGRVSSSMEISGELLISPDGSRVSMGGNNLFVSLKSYNRYGKTTVNRNFYIESLIPVDTVRTMNIKYKMYPSEVAFPRQKYYLFYDPGTYSEPEAVVGMTSMGRELTSIIIFGTHPEDESDTFAVVYKPIYSISESVYIYSGKYLDSQRNFDTHGELSSVIRYEYGKDGSVKKADTYVKDVWVSTIYYGKDHTVKKSLQFDPHDPDARPEVIRYSYKGNNEDYTMICYPAKRVRNPFRTTIVFEGGRMISNAMETEYGTFAHQFRYNERGDLCQTRDMNDGTVTVTRTGYDHHGNWVQKMNYKTLGEGAVPLTFQLRSIIYHD